MKKSLFTLIILILNIFLTYGQCEFNKNLQTLIDSGQFVRADSMYFSILKSDSTSPQISIEYANILYAKSKNEMVNISKGGLGVQEEGFKIYDMTGNEVGKITNSIIFDTSMTLKAIGILQSALFRFPYRLDLRFGIAHMYQQLDDFDNQYKTLLDAVDYGKKNSNNLRWTDNQQLDMPAIDFLSGTLYDYSIEEYNKETIVGDERYLKLSELLTNNFPKHPMSYLNIAYYYYNKKDWKNCVTYFEKANEANPNDNNILYNLAENYIMLGDSEKGKKYLENIIELGSDKEFVKYAKKRLKEIK